MYKILPLVKRSFQLNAFFKQTHLSHVILFIISLLGYGCSPAPSPKAPAILTGETAQWIQDDRPLPTTDSLFYEEQPAPVFRREIQIDRPVEQARLLITAAGYYQAYLNGKTVGNSALDPGWGHMIDQGATTIWETWKESDNTFSNNHPMFGTVTEWYYRWLAGIRPRADYPGFQRFMLAPNTPEGLDSINCTYYTPLGAIVSNWEKTEDGAYQFHFTIPKESQAQVRLPLREGQRVGMTDANETIEGLESGSFVLEGGIYSFVVSEE